MHGSDISHVDDSGGEVGRIRCRGLLELLWLLLMLTHGDGLFAVVIMLVFFEAWGLRAGG